MERKHGRFMPNSWLNSCAEQDHLSATTVTLHYKPKNKVLEKSPSVKQKIEYTSTNHSCKIRYGKSYLAEVSSSSVASSVTTLYDSFEPSPPPSSDGSVADWKELNIVEWQDKGVCLLIVHSS